MFRNFLHHTKSWEGDAAGLDFKDKVSKRIYPEWRFYSGQPILHFVIVTYVFIYLINLIGQK